MGRAWVTDRWVKDAVVTMPDGTTTKISATSAQLRSLKTLPEHFRTSKFMKGSRWEVGWHDPTAAGRRQVKKLFARRSDADAFAAELEDDIRSDRYIDPASRARTYRAVAEAWLASKNRIKDSSYFRYRRELDNYVLPKWGERTIGSITRTDIDEWILQLRDGTAVHDFDRTEYLKQTKARKPRTPVKMKPSYLRHVASATFGGPLRYAVREGWIGRDPFRNVELPRDEGDLESDLPSLSYQDIDALADAALEITDNESDRWLVQTLAVSGPRIGEATALKIKDLDLSNKRVRIHRTWTTDREGKRKLGPVKTWEKRWLPLADFIVSGLKAIIKDRDPEDYVFTSPRGAAVDGRNWRNRVWEKAQGAVGLTQHLSVHDLRHVAATNAIAAGADVKLVQQMLGHKDATETLNTYSHLWPNRVAEVIAKIEKRRRKALKNAHDKAA
ncbi:MAG TPA: tyrosine-type recombinase/integrase [Microbacterium sp.]|nr:tyrosine-type recombinase/integrase [Microbacterium sp.]